MLAAGGKAAKTIRTYTEAVQWFAAELPEPMAGLRPPGVTGRLVPVFTSEELTRLEHACAV